MVEEQAIACGVVGLDAMRMDQNGVSRRAA